MNRRGWLVAMATLLFALGIAAEAAAQARPPRPGAGRPVRPSVVERVDVSARTVTIHGQVYRVGSGTRMADADGNRIRLRDLRARSGSRAGDMVEFTVAEGSGGAREIRTLKIIPVLLP